MTEEEQRVVRAVIDWLTIRHKAGVEIDYEASNGNQLWHDAMHSSLLPRLLAGKRPLPTPPPLHSSSPWYSLVEQGHAYIHPTGFKHFAPGESVFSDKPFLLIEGSVWTVLEEHEHDGRPAWRVADERGHVADVLWAGEQDASRWGVKPGSYTVGCHLMTLVEAPGAEQEVP